MNNKLIVFLLASLLLTGCADAIGVLALFGHVAPEDTRMLSFYCEQDRIVEIKSSEREEHDKTTSWREVCGWEGVEFVPATGRHYSPGRYERLHIYKKVLHRSGQADVVVYDSLIPEEYVVLGEYHLPERWYHMRTVEDYLRQVTGNLGGNAVSEFHAYIASAGDASQESASEGHVMRVDATVIRYLEAPDWPD